MLSLKSLITPSAMLAAFSLLATPTFAGQRDHGRQGSEQQSSGRSAERAQAQPRQAEGRAVERSQPRAEAVAPSRVETQRAIPQAPRVETRRAIPQAPRVETQRANPQTYRAESQRVSPQVDRRRDVGGQRAIPRSEVVGPRGGAYAPRYAPRYSPRYEPRYGYGVRGYYRPYVYRPRISIGFGIFAGYPVPWAYSFPYPVEVYGYAAPRGPVMVTPGSNAYGGVALEITPDDAAVYVDGTYAGLVRDFDGSTQPLTLTGGTHRIDIEAQGFAPLSFDVGVQPGQVIPYRGDLQYR